MIHLTRRAALGGLAAIAALPAWAAGRRSEVAFGKGRATVEGRTAFTPAGALRIGYPGVALRMMADTPTLQMRVNATSPDTFLSISVDDATPSTVRLKPGQQDLTVFEGAAGTHRIDIVKRTEAWQGQIEVIGFAQAGDGQIAPVPLPDRRLLFIGDSITCGAGLDAAIESKADGPETSDGSRAFGRLLGKRFEAQAHLVSYGGKGLIRDWQGKTTEVTAPQFYERAMPDDPGTPWDHRRYVPHAVGVCLGTNDFNKGVPDREAFVGAYAAFARKILHDAPGAYLLLIDSPMIGDDTPEKHLSVLTGYLGETVARVGNPRCVHARLRHYLGRPTNSHPIYPEHVAIAAELAPLVSAATGWA